MAAFTSRTAAGIIEFREQKMNIVNHAGLGRITEQ